MEYKRWGRSNCAAVSLNIEILSTSNSLKYVNINTPIVGLLESTQSSTFNSSVPYFTIHSIIGVEEKEYLKKVLFLFEFTTV